MWEKVQELFKAEENIRCWLGGVRSITEQGWTNCVYRSEESFLPKHSKLFLHSTHGSSQNMQGNVDVEELIFLFKANYL